MTCKLWSSCLDLNLLKASFPHTRYNHDYSNPLHIRKQHVSPTFLLNCCLKSHISMIIWYPTKRLQNIAIIKILFSLVVKYWHIWQKVHCGIFQIIIDSTVVSKNKEYWWSSIWYAIALKTESRHDANAVIAQVVIMMTTFRDHSDDKVGITKVFDFRYYPRYSEHQDYGCNTLPLTTISWMWISFVLPCFE